MTNYTVEQIEERLVVLWRKILGIEGLESHQNFFALGGHSLLAIDLLNEVEERLGVRLNMKDVVESPTVKQMSLAIKQKVTTGALTIEHGLVESGLYPLTLNQKQVWSLNVLYPDSVTHNISTAIRIKRKLDIKLLTDAINLVVERQESLRTRFKIAQGVPWQEIIPEYHYQFKFVDIKEEDLKDEIQKQMKFIFKLDEAPLMRVIFYRLKEDEYVFFFMVHHIVWDGLSNTFFFHEFIEVYEKLEAKEKPELAPVKMSYKEHALREAQYLKSDEFIEQKNAWKEILQGRLP